jgi:hypothetical protein
VPGVPEPLVPLPEPVAPEPEVEPPEPPPPVEGLVPLAAGAPFVPDSVVVPGPEVVPVAPAPMPVLLRLCVLVLSLELDPAGVVDWQPAASSATIEKLSKVA